MTPETVQVMAVPHRCVARWERAGYRGSAWAAVVELGTLPDDRWYVWVVSQSTDSLARLYPDEQSARGVAERWQQRIGGQWEQIPCSQTRGWQPGEREDQHAVPDPGSETPGQRSG